MAEALLQDRRLLVVEDEYTVAEAMERSLRRAGAIVIGPVPSVAQALALLDRESAIDGALLDINLGRHKVYPVVDRLLARGTRCIFTTGNDPADVPAAYAHVARCEKPVGLSCVVEALQAGDGAHGTTGTTTQHFLVLQHMRDQLLAQIRLAEEHDQTLLAAKLCEAVDVVEASLQN